jgi:hypothetical protein
MLYQQKKKRFQVFFAPSCIITILKKIMNSLFLCESQQQKITFFCIPLHIITTKKITKLFFLVEPKKKQLKKKHVVGLSVIMAKVHIIIGIGNFERQDWQKNC